MRLYADDIGVDAGMIMVADLGYLETVPKRDDPNTLGKVFKVRNGIYEASWVIPDTWNGRISGKKTLRVSSGKIFVSDPCYVIGGESDEWMEWLEATDYGEKLRTSRAFVIDEMGGDGCYEVILDLKKKK
jgi:hypothetical protein